MGELTADQAAAIARGVYLLRTETVAQANARRDILGSEGLFNVTEKSPFQGLTGGLYVCKIRSGFGYIAEGIGQRKGEVLIASRGTDILIDWWTNASVGLEPGPGGLRARPR